MAHVFLAHKNKKRDNPDKVGLLLTIGDYVRIAHGPDVAMDIRNISYESTLFDIENDPMLGEYGFVETILLPTNETTEEIYTYDNWSPDGILVTVDHNYGKTRMNMDALINYSVIPENYADNLFEDTKDKNVSFYYTVEDTCTVLKDDYEFPEHLQKSVEYSTMRRIFWEQNCFFQTKLLKLQIEENKKERMKVWMTYANESS